MKKYLKLSLLYAILAMIGGIFYREFTKIYDFMQPTTLSVVHVHLFVLGMIFILLLGLYQDKLSLSQNKLYQYSFISYNLFLILMVIMMLIKGILQVTGSTYSIVLTAISGLSHTGLGISLFLILFSLFKVASDKKDSEN